MVNVFTRGNYVVLMIIVALCYLLVKTDKALTSGIIMEMLCAFRQSKGNMNLLAFL